MSYTPVIGEDEQNLGATSLDRMETVDFLQLRSLVVPAQTRKQLATEYDLDWDEWHHRNDALGENDVSKLSKREYYQQLAEALFDDLPEGEVDFAEVRRAKDDFTSAGSASPGELLNGIKDLANFQTPQTQMDTSES